MNSFLKSKTCSGLRRAVIASESSSSIRSFSTIDTSVKPSPTSLSQFGGVHGTKSGTAKMW